MCCHHLLENSESFCVVGDRVGVEMNDVIRSAAWDEAVDGACAGNRVITIAAGSRAAFNRATCRRAILSCVGASRAAL